MEYKREKKKEKNYFKFSFWWLFVDLKGIHWQIFQKNIFFGSLWFFWKWKICRFFGIELIKIYLTAMCPFSKIAKKFYIYHSTHQRGNVLRFTALSWGCTTLLSGLRIYHGTTALPWGYGFTWGFTFGATRKITNICIDWTLFRLSRRQPRTALSITVSGKVLTQAEGIAVASAEKNCAMSGIRSQPLGQRRVKIYPLFIVFSFLITLK